MTHLQARLLLIATLVALFAPILVRGEVIFPHDNRLEVGLPDLPEDGRLSNRKFTDHSLAFVPALHEQLRGDRAGWISTWTPHVEMGRPTAHVSGFSRAYLPTTLLAWISDDPFVVYTALVLLAMGLTGLFGLALFKELGLQPAAALVGALGLAAGPFMTARMTFAMFVWGVCWTVAILWLVSAYLRHARPHSHSRVALGLGLAFSVHALFLTAYPQQIIWHAYLLAGYVLLRLARSPAAPRVRLGLAFQLAAWASLGLVSVAPVYLDLALNAARSARLETPDSFFLQRMPTLAGWRDALLFWSQTFDTTWIGHPFGGPDSLDESARLGGMSLTPLFALLAVLSLTRGLARKLWSVHGFLGLCLLLTVWHDAYLFAVHHVGLGLSRFRPAFAMHVPVMVAGAYAVDRALRGQLRLTLASGAVLVTLVAAASFGFVASGLTLHTDKVALGIGSSLVLALFLGLPRPALIAGLASVSTVVYGLPLLLTRPQEEIRLTSPLIKVVHEATDDGTRFAWVDKSRGRTLTPNQESLFDLRSPHSYNSLSSKSYQDWVPRLSGRGTQILGRRFGSLASGSDLDAEELSLAGVGLLVSPHRLDPELTTSLGKVRGVFLGQPKQPAVLQAQVRVFETLEEGAVAVSGQESFQAVRRTHSQDDRLIFGLEPAPETTLLFISQQHHPQWLASADGDPATTVSVNSFYQGVLLPPGTRTVELVFRPHVRWSWVPQLGFALAALGILWRRRRRQPQTTAR